MKLEINTKAPDFALKNQDDIEVRLSDFIGSKVVLYFYPKDNTKGCTIEAKDFTALENDFLNKGFNIIGVSPDSVTSHKNFINKQALKITLLSDENREVASLYGAYGMKKNYGKESMGIIRSTFIIDEEGILRNVMYGVKATGHAQRVFDALK